MTNVAQEIESAKELLERALRRLRKALDDAGGRGIELANEIDRLQFAIVALDGELYCPHCEARLTSGL